jgi:hypothetical protein
MFLKIGILLISTLAAVTAPQSRKTVWSGVYTTTQAERGRGLYETHCFECHNGDLDPKNTASRLIGARFMDKWREDSIGNLFHFVSTSMPRNAPATLTEEAYLDVVAFLLQLNALPTGNSDLTKDALESIQIEYKEGPRPLPTNAAIDVVGCLSVDADETFTITSATEPVRARKPNEASPEELSAAAGRPLGPHTFRLQNLPLISNFRPFDNVGHKILVKGLLIRQLNRERINLSYLKVIDAACEP